MGLFDVKCALSGLILQGGRTLVLPLVRDGKTFVPVGLPIAGEYDRYGKLDPVDADPVAEHFAAAFVRRAKFDGAPKKGLPAFVSRLTAPDEDPPELEGRMVAFAYVREGVYRAFVESGVKSARVRVEGGDAFDRAFARADEARALYAGIAPSATDALARALDAFAQSGLGHGAIEPAKEADYIQASKKQLKARLTKARRELADVPGIEIALDDYERREINGEAPDAVAVAPAVRARLARSALGFAAAGDALELVSAGERVRVYVIAGSEKVDVWMDLTLEGGRCAKQRVARLGDSSNAREIEEAVTKLEQSFAGKLEERRALLGVLPAARVIEMARDSRGFLAEAAISPHIEGDVLTQLATAMMKFPYTDDVRLAWIAILSRPDCSRAIPEALRDHTSKSVREAALAKLAASSATR